MNLNKVFLIGNLTKDPELRTMPSGTAVVSFSIATNRMWTDQKGEKKQETQFHNLVCFDRQAEIVKQYLKKGSMAFIEGRIQNRSWEGQDGTKKYKTEIVVERLQLGPRTSGGSNFSKSAAAESSTKEPDLDTIEYPQDNNDPDAMPF